VLQRDLMRWHDVKYTPQDRFVHVGGLWGWDKGVCDEGGVHTEDVAVAQLDRVSDHAYRMPMLMYATSVTVRSNPGGVLAFCFSTASFTLPISITRFSSCTRRNFINS